MKTNLLTLEPSLVWKHFSAISAIPRGSKHEQGVLEHLKKLFDSLHLTWKQDKTGNLMVRKPGTPGHEKAAAVAFQGHLDMVCEQNSGTNHDFLHQGIDVLVDGDWVRANGTTLGADNGIGVALMLALVEDESLEHGPIECLFTLDEETGLNGALGLDKSLLSAKMLINLDSGRLGEFVIGCAGGITTTGLLPLKWETGKKLAAWKILITGLRGGHSGVNIHEGRGNALILGSRLLDQVRQADPQGDWRLWAFNGGDKHNAIPREVVLGLTSLAKSESDAESLLKDQLQKVKKIFKQELGSDGDNLDLRLTKEEKKESWLSSADTEKVSLMAILLPHGVEGMSKVIPGLVETSSNLALLKLTEKGLETVTSQRSSSASLLQEMSRKAEAPLYFAGAEIHRQDGYPAWSPSAHSALKDLCISLWTRQFGKAPKIEVIHAGLECGIIGEKYPDMDMISLGPDIEEEHTPDERLKVSSVQQVYGYLKVLLKEVQ